MLVIHKVTFRYLPLEDRICINAETAVGDRLCLWLTQRLARQLIPHLPHRTMAADAVDAELVATETAEQFADAESDCTAPVECDITCDAFLIASIDLKNPKEQLSLVFKDENDNHRAAISLGPDEGQQISEALTTCFSAAGWHLGVLRRSTLN